MNDDSNGAFEVLGGCAELVILLVVLGVLFALILR